MNRYTLLIIGLLIHMSCSHADCPSLAFVIPQLPVIAHSLKVKDMKPILIDDREHTVHYGETGKAVDDILAGKFQGHSIHRLEETELGVCEYLLTDDNTPATGSFYLRYEAER